MWPMVKRPAQTRREATPPRHQGAADAATQQPKPRARGPSAATWPERSDMARDAARAAATGPRPGARRITAFDLEAKTRKARGIAMGVVRGSALLAEIPAQKT